MTTRNLLTASTAILLAAATQAAFAQDNASASPAIVSHIKVLSDKVEDVSSLEAWKQSFIKPGMTEKEKALAVWTTVVKFRQQTQPPNEYLESDGGNVHDPIKTFNVYGYGMCCCASADIEALARYAGMESRGWGINHHSVPEVKIDGHWSLLDSSLIQYFNLPDGKIAGVMEISDSCVKWLDENPEYKKITDHNALYNIMRKGEWKRIGPEVLKGSATYDDNGWQPAHTHAWGDTILEYGSTSVNDKMARKPFLTEYGTALGYEVNIQLRPGEKLIRNWGNKGLDINQLDSGKPANILKSNPQDPTQDMRYAPAYGDLNEGRAGNGTLEYNPPLASLAATALTCNNLTLSKDGIHTRDISKPGTLIIRIPSSYVFLDGLADFEAKGHLDVSISDNNGLDWKEFGGVGPDGTWQTAEYMMKPYIARKYDYQLKLEFKDAETFVRSIKLTHDIMQSQRVLPNLDKGDTKISFSTGPQEGTITIHGNLSKSVADPTIRGDKNLIFSQYHPTLDNVEPSNLKVQSGTGTVTIPISTPGDMTRLRMGIFYRAAGENDSWNAEVSFDNGKTYAPLINLPSSKGDSKYIVFDKVPAHTHAALVKLTGKASAPDNVFIRDLRFDADYTEPHGGFAPVKVTYQYEENGQPKTNAHIATSPADTYTIHCDTKPKMKSITLELAE